MEYANNSNKFKEEQRNASVADEKRKVEKVVTGPVKVKKKTGLQTFFGSIFNDDTTSIKSFIVNDVVIPSIKKGISEILNICLWGTPSQNSRSSSQKVSYRRYYDEPSYRDPAPTVSNKCDYDEIAFQTRGDAEGVLTQMCDLIDAYGTCSLADMYEAAGMSCDYTYNNYGWTNLASASTRRTRHGDYVLDLPKPRPLKR